MSEAIKTPSARQMAEEAYFKMLSAYEIYYRMREDPILRDNYKSLYDEELYKYRELCTVIVERLLRENPAVLEDMHVLYM